MKLSQIKNPALRLQVSKKLAKSKQLIKIKKNKFGAKKTKEGDSRQEVRRKHYLENCQLSKEIHSLQTQKKFVLVEKYIDVMGTKEQAVTYKCDFFYFDCFIGKWVAEDVKSKPTAQKQDYVIKRKLFKQKYPDICFRELIYNWNNETKTMEVKQIN